jgi:hypothetical protein
MRLLKNYMSVKKFFKKLIQTHTIYIVLRINNMLGKENI